MRVYGTQGGSALFLSRVQEWEAKAMLYQNIRCPNCGYSFTGGWTAWAPPVLRPIGEPLVKCPSCARDLLTGRVEWESARRIVRGFYVAVEVSLFLVKAAMLRLILLVAFDQMNMDDDRLWSILIALTVAGIHSLASVTLTVRASLRRTRVLSEQEKDRIRSALLRHAGSRRRPTGWGIVPVVIVALPLLFLLVGIAFVILRCIVEIIFYL